MERTVIPAMARFGTTIFAEMSALALKTGAVNLGQGFPDSDGPREVLEAAKQAIDDGINQYPPGRGLPVLREAVAAHQREWYGIDLDPRTDVLVTAGVTEGLSASVIAFVRPGDEVVVLDPYFDVYDAVVAMVGGVLKSIPLAPPDFALDTDAARAAFSERTRMVILNSPHNPTGRVLTEAELRVIADLACEFDAIVISDEVYEHLTFDEHVHRPIATLPGMAERTLTMASGGKTFSVTGWKVGWVTGPADLVAACTTVKQYLTFVSGAPLQVGVAAGLGQPPQRFAERAATLARGRDILLEGLEGTGLRVLGPGGTAESGYFLLVDFADLGVEQADAAFVRRLADLVGVVGIPLTPFCEDPSRMGSVLRLAFCKSEPVLREGARRLHSIPAALTESRR